MPRVTLALIIVCLAAIGPPATAEMCVMDAVPAATLLLPYFEVDLDEDPEVSTIFTIHNALPTPTLAHVSFWSDWSEPVLDFDIFLTGYDAQTIDLFSVLRFGILPVTADDQSDRDLGDGRDQDPTSSCDGTEDSCSPQGRPDWDGSFDGSNIPVAGVADCIDIFPFFVNPLLPEPRREEMQRKLTGQPFNDVCFGSDRGDNRARGYITIDNANACSLIFPNDPGYFGDEVNPGVASNVNQLWGDWSLIDFNYPEIRAVDPLIHIEAADDFDSSSTPTNYTFYGRYTQALGGIDHREPLGTAWGVSYFNSRPELVSDLIVWRDSTANTEDGDGYACETGPDWQPLDQTQVVCFDQRENAVELCADRACFGVESQRLEVGQGDLGLFFNAGWCFLNLNIPGDEFDGDVDFPATPAGDIAQSWVGSTPRRGTMVSGGLNSVLLSHACDNASPMIENVGRTGSEARR